MTYIRQTLLTLYIAALGALAQNPKSIKLITRKYPPSTVTVNNYWHDDSRQNGCNGPAHESNASHA
jgi:hypothetical protein